MPDLLSAVSVSQKMRRDVHQPGPPAGDVSAEFQRLHRKVGEGGGGAEKIPGRDGAGGRHRGKEEGSRTGRG